MQYAISLCSVNGKITMDDMCRADTLAQRVLLSKQRLPPGSIRKLFTSDRPVAMVIGSELFWFDDVETGLLYLKELYPDSSETVREFRNENGVVTSYVIMRKDVCMMPHVPSK